MPDLPKERGPLVAKHDFDMLPRSRDIEVRPAQCSELLAVADMGNRMVPGVKITADDLQRYFAFDPDSILIFGRHGKLLGSVAFIYLNRSGLEALLRAEMRLTQPDFSLLAGRFEQASAIYVWAIAGQGRAMAGLGNVSEHLCKKRLAPADLYAQPSSEDGRNLMIAIGFTQIESSQRELWRYQRPWNRTSANMGAGTSAGSFANARL